MRKRQFAAAQNTRMSELLVMNAWRSSFRSLRSINPAISDFIHMHTLALVCNTPDTTYPYKLSTLLPISSIENGRPPPGHNSGDLCAVYSPSELCSTCQTNGLCPLFGQAVLQKAFEHAISNAHIQGCFQLCRAMRTENSENDLSHPYQR